MNIGLQVTNYVVMLFLAVYYVYIIMEFVDKILEKPRLNRWQRIILGCINAGGLWIAMEMDVSAVPVLYVITFVVMFVEFKIFYRDRLKRVYFITSACLCHIMAMRAIIVSAFAWKMGKTYYEIATSSTLSVLSISAMYLLLNLAVFIVIKVIPAEKVRIVNQHEEQLVFMSLWLTVFNAYMIINARVYSHNIESPVVVENQMMMPIVVLLGLYIVLFFSFKMGELLGYQAQHEELVQGYYKEQQYRVAITSEALFSYETNFTQRRIVSGFEMYKDKLGGFVHNYEYMRNHMIKELVHEKDAEVVFEYASLENILRLFEQGNMELPIEYRRIDEFGDYRWVRAVTHLYQDKVSKDVMGFTYVKDIDDEKQKQLALQERAERDSLTGIYNKGTTEILMSSYLKLDVERKNKGALFLIDVDNFKAINDHLGHTQGDLVLCELSKSLKGIFRTDDIVGRVGGDEFLVFMKRSKDEESIKEKAIMICQNFEKSYTSSFGVRYFISASIGIAIYPKHGILLDELYKKADIALYKSKNKGKNTFSVYQGEDFTCYESNRTTIDETDEALKKHFKDDRPGYVFETLYRSKDMWQSIGDILELLTIHYNYSRGYIFETDEDGRTTRNTCEWCNEGISPEISRLNKVPIEAVEASTKAFYRDGKFIMKSLDNLPDLDRSVLEPQGIKSMLQFGIFEDKQLKGFIGFDDCNSERHPDEREIEELETVCNIIATFLVKHRAQEKIKEICDRE